MTQTVAVYVRLSLLTEKSVSVERQRESCEAYAKARGWTVVGVYEDVDVSASKTTLDERPGLDRLRSSGADVWLVWKLDRLARRVSDLSTLVDESKERGAAIVSATEPFDLTTPMGRSMAQILSVFAELEASTIGLRVSAAKSKLKRDGRWSGGTPPFGYRVQKRNGGPGVELVVDETEAELVREAAQRILDGASFYSVVKSWNERGILSRRGKRWTTTSLVTLLTGEGVLGRVKDRGAPVEVDELGIVVPTYEPILNLETVEKIRATRKRLPHERTKRSRIASGLFVCGSCGANVIVSSTRQGPHYTCGRRDAPGSCPQRPTTQAKIVEPYLEAELLSRFGDFSMMEAVPDRANAAELAEVEEAIEAVTAEIGEAVTVEAVERLQKLQALRTQLDGDRSRTPQLRPTGLTVRETWESADVAGRRALLESSIVGRPKLFPGRKPIAERVEIEWKTLVVTE